MSAVPFIRIAIMPKEKPKSLKVIWPTEMLFATQFENNISRDDGIRQTIADIMKDKDRETLQKLVCMAAFAQEANKELSISSLPEAIEEILNLCQYLYAENNTDSKRQISDMFYNISDRLNRIESDIEENKSRFLSSFIQRNLSQSLELLRRETIG
jgi:hypothetical protein